MHARGRTEADRSEVHIRGGYQGCCGSRNSDSNVGDDDDGRRIRGSSCQEIAVAVATSCFRPTMMTERISIRRQGL